MAKQPNPDYDYLSLQLAYYLASWGMLRGSSFLLWKDYKIHIPMVKEMLKPEYDCLQGVECHAFLQKEIQVAWQKLNTTLADYYESVRKSINDDVKKGISSVLLSKILLGVLACVPAYDRFFMSAVKEYKVASSIYGLNSLVSLSEFYSIYHNELEKLRKTLAFDGIPYPQMKLLDMGFWQLGMDAESESVKS